MTNDVHAACTQLEYFAGLAGEAKGETIPMGDGAVNLTVREPFGVCARIVAYNHPLMFTAAKMAAPLAAGNTVIMKPPQQAPLSAYRMMELSATPCRPACSTSSRAASTAARRWSRIADSAHRADRSVPTGRDARGAAERLKHVTLELGGKNACIIFADADVDKQSQAQWPA